MTSLKDRLFYLASVSLALIAFILHLLARGEITRAQTLKAKNIEAAINQQSAVVVDPAAKSLSDGGRMLNIVGVMFTVSGIICLILSAYHQESGFYSIPILLSCADVAFVGMIAPI